jgi:hypothetical protein
LELRSNVPLLRPDMLLHPGTQSPLGYLGSTLPRRLLDRATGDAKAGETRGVLRRTLPSQPPRHQRLDQRLLAVELVLLNC